MKMLRRLVSISLACVVVPPVFAQSVPVRFSLEIGGNAIGKAEYQFLPKKDGFTVKSSYSFSAGSIHADSTREGQLGAKYELKSDALTVKVSGGTQEAKITAYPKDSRFMFEATVAGEVLDHSFPFYPRTVVLNDFDPSGVQGLLYLASTQPPGTQDYWVLVAKGRGIQSPAQLIPASDGEGTLDGTKIALKHWQLTVGAVVMDIWANEQNLLMEAAVASQALAYRREGFTRKDGVATSDPAPGVPTAQPTSKIRASGNGNTYMTHPGP
jgi:hypothetical protein